MAAQELCLSNYEDIIDAATVEGEFSCLSKEIYENECRFVRTAPIDVTPIINNDLQQRPIVAYFCRSASIPAFGLDSIGDIKAICRYFWDKDTLSIRVSMLLAMKSNALKSG
jgi:hypothetical protein